LGRVNRANELPSAGRVAYPTRVIEEEPGATTEQIDRQAPFGDRVLLVIDGAALQVMPLPGSGTLAIGRASKARSCRRTTASSSRSACRS
jgi:hypothetical protein